jgi:hypothetical protein
MENTSGHGPASTVPASIDRWNWGAFLLNWIWGIGNQTYIALLMFVPFVNIVMMFILGVKGSSWAWRNKKWDSVEHFQTVQRKWALWGLVAWLAVGALTLAMIFTIVGAMKSSDAFRLALSRLEQDEQVSRIIGKPISTGMPMGSINVSGPRGSAALTFSVEGPNGKGTVHVEAAKDLGQWKIGRMVLDHAETGRRIDLSE